MGTKLCCVLGTLSKDFVKTPLPVKTRGGSKKDQANLPRKLMEKYDFRAALNADTLDEALSHIQLGAMSIEELEDLACMFAFNSGSSKIPPTKRENDLAGICLDKVEELEANES